MDRPRTHRLRLRRAVAAVFAAATPLCLAAAAWADEAATASADAAANAAATSAADPATAVAWINTARLPLLVALVIICGSVVAGIALARSGRPLRIRRLAALDAVDEAIGRATEMGRSVLFVPGIQDMTDIQTVAGVTVLGRVARTAAEYDARLEVPTSRSIVMAAARETVQAAHYSAGRPETYNESNIYYITDEQFGYVAAVTGKQPRHAVFARAQRAAVGRQCGAVAEGLVGVRGDLPGWPARGSPARKMIDFGLGATTLVGDGHAYA